MDTVRLVPMNAAPGRFEYLRDTPAGQLFRKLGFKSWLLYPDEKPNFEMPIFPTVGAVSRSGDGHNLKKSTPKPAETVDDLEMAKPRGSDTVDALEKAMSKAFATVDSFEKSMSMAFAIVDVLEREEHSRRFSGSDQNPMIVSWYKNDSENPRNWSQTKKLWTMTIIILYTFVVYCGASIIAPTAEIVMHRYNISQDVASLGLSMYVLGYGLGPMFLSPISEIPAIGRNPPYWISFIFFFITSVLLAVVDNFPAIVVLRFFQGLFGSPALASGAASIEDIYEFYTAPYGYIWWVAAMYCGPSFGPVLAGYAVFDNWRWPMWEMVIMAGIVTVLLPFLPETYSPTILRRRAQRLRERAANNSYKAPSELQPLNFGATLSQALLKPIEIAVKDPAITYACVYCALVYATYYSFFEAFPIVYLGFYRMTLGEMGLIFTSLSVGCVIGVTFYTIYLRNYFIPRARQQHARNGKPVEPEAWLRVGLLGVWGVPAGLLIFAWTARPDIHWSAPTAGIVVWSSCSFVVFQSLICWLPPTYPRYIASLFAANDLTRSTLAAGFVQFTRLMYVDLGIDRGVSLLAGLSLLGIVGHYGLYYFGGRLRERSKFTDSTTWD